MNNEIDTLHLSYPSYNTVQDTLEENYIFHIYHGTCENYIKKVKIKGLDLSKLKQPFFGQLRSCVTFLYNDAKEYAIWLSQNLKKSPYVLTIDIPKSIIPVPQNMHLPPFTKGMYLIVISSMYIPSSCIKLIEKIST